MDHANDGAKRLGEAVGCRLHDYAASLDLTPRGCGAAPAPGFMRKSYVIRCHGDCAGLPSGVVASVRFSIFETRSSLTPNTTSESRYLSPSMKTWVISGSYPLALTRKCTCAGRIGWRLVCTIISPTGPSVGIG